MQPGLADRIDAALPQTQCTKCGFDGCRPYAEALARGEADLDRCPPGGAEGIRELARLLGRAEKALNAANGVEKPRSVALIDESRCIGCMLCVKACPVDAIVGAPKLMHTVLTESCSGCDLCLPPCPVDCIEMMEVAALAERGNRHAAKLAARSTHELATMFRQRYEFHRTRLAREHVERGDRLASKASHTLAALERLPASADTDRKKAAVRAAIDRARARRNAGGKP
ncbi:MAG TPA: electron transport complex subunit RsxB [Burkholderiales bacterium]|nr:electron transport complex subunit RsxB [Burkholderiales bacterium]